MTKIDRASRIDVPYVIRELFIYNLFAYSNYTLTSSRVFDALKNINQGLPAMHVICHLRKVNVSVPDCSSLL